MLWKVMSYNDLDNSDFYKIEVRFMRTPELEFKMAAATAANLILSGDKNFSVFAETDGDCIEVFRFRGRIDKIDSADRTAEEYEQIAYVLSAMETAVNQ